MTKKGRPRKKPLQNPNDGKTLNGWNFAGTLEQISSPEIRLAVVILREAQRAALEGDLSALTFLITDGTKLEDFIIPDTTSDRITRQSMILSFCEDTWNKIKSGDIVPTWADIELKKEFSLFFK